MIIGYNIESDLNCLGCTDIYIDKHFEGNKEYFYDYIEYHGYAIDVEDLEGRDGMEGFGHITCVGCGNIIE